MKKLKTQSKRGLAIFLTLIMCLGMLNLTVFAEEPNAPEIPDPDLLVEIDGKEEPAETDGEEALNEPDGEEELTEPDSEEELTEPDGAEELNEPDGEEEPNEPDGEEEPNEPDGEEELNEPDGEESDTPETPDTPDASDMSAEGAGSVTVKEDDCAVLGHDLADHEAKEPTCVEFGWNAYQTCSRCDYTTYEQISANGHTVVIDEAVPATVTEAGLTEGRHCSVCDLVLAPQEPIPSKVEELRALMDRVEKLLPVTKDNADELQSLVEPLSDLSVIVFDSDGYDGKADDELRYQALCDEVYDGFKMLAEGAVAKVNDVGYDTLQAAIDAAQEGNTVVLLKNVDEAVVINGSVTLDLDNHEIATSNSIGVHIKSGTVTVKNGSVEGTSYGVYVAQGGNNVTLSNLTVKATNKTTYTGKFENQGYGVRVGYGSAGGENVALAINNCNIYGSYIGLTVGDFASATVTGDTVIRSDYYGVSVWGWNGTAGPATTFTMTGGKILVEGGDVAGNGIAGNGGYHGSVISLTDVTVEAPGAGIYHPQLGRLTIDGGFITGKVGIQLCAGDAKITAGETVSITNATIIGTGEDNRANKTGDGFINDGAAISLVDRNYPGGQPSITIIGGTIKSEHSEAVLAYTWNSKGASFEEKVTEWSDAKDHVSISGGTYSSDVSAYVMDGYYQNADGEVVSGEGPVYGSVAAIGSVGYPTLQAAINAAKDDDTVVLLKDVEVDDVIEVKKSITIKGDNRKVTSTAARILRVETSNVTVNLEGIEFISNTAERGVQVDTNLTNVKLNIDSCKVLAKYAVQVCGGAEDITVSISDSTIQGYAAIQMWSKAEISVKDSTLIGYNTSAGDSNGFSAIVFNGDAYGSSSGSTLTVSNSTVKTVTTDPEYALEKVLSVQGTGTENITATFTDCTFEAKLRDSADNETDTDLYVFYGPSTIAENNRVTVDGVTYAITAGMWEQKIEDAVAEVNGVRYFILPAAIDAAKDGDTVVLLKDIVLEHGAEIKNNKGEVTGYQPALTIDKAITIEGNGFTLSRMSDGTPGSFDTYHRNASGTAAELYRTFDTTGTINFTMFNVADNASLTLSNVKVDDGVRWTVDEDYELLTCTGPLAKQSLIKVGKNAKLDLTGCEITGIHADCTGAVINALNSEASVTTIADTSITGCVSGSDGLAYRVGTTTGATVTLKSGAKVDGNYNYNTFNHAIFMIYNANTMTMEDGSSVSGNFYHGNGAIGLYSSATFTMDGGQINGNRFVSYIGGYAANLRHNNNSHGPAVYIHLNSTFIMNGGEIKNNVVHLGAIMDQSINPTVILMGGEISGNGADENKDEVFRNAQLYLNVASTNHWTMSKDVKIVGDIILDDGTLISEFEVDAQVRPTVDTDKVVVKTANDDGTWTYTLGQPAEGEISVTLNRSSASLNHNRATNNTVRLAATTNPENAVVTWTSSNETVATVDANGLVTAKANGTATITAKVGGVTATCTVRVSTYTAPVTPTTPSTGGGSTGGGGSTSTGGGGGSTGTTGGSVIIDDPDVPLADLPLPFEDVKEADWFREAVAYVYFNGLMKGVSDTRFAPYDITTRSMIATVLYRLENEPDVTFRDIFADVENGMWYSDSITWAADNGIVKGYDNGNFGPRDYVTRQQLVTMLYRYAQSKGYDVSAQGSLDDYSDGADVSNAAKDGMIWAVGAGLIKGDDGKLNPGNYATRAHISAIFQRFCEKFGEVS